MVFDITCKNGCDVHIILNLLTKLRKKIDKQFYAELQLILGNGIKSIAVVTALLGMHNAIGNDVIWKKCVINMEKFKQNLQRIVVRKVWKKKSMQLLPKMTMKLVVI